VRNGPLGIDNPLPRHIIIVEMMIHLALLVVLVVLVGGVGAV
jgi:hypothetical protein